jgi:hypothetical protein
MLFMVSDIVRFRSFSKLSSDVGIFIRDSKSNFCSLKQWRSLNEIRRVLWALCNTFSTAY